MARRFSDRQLGLARQQRRGMTAAEDILWRALRDRGIGAKFRRQLPVGPYIADFACIAARLVVELDGAPHDDPAQRAHDARRDAWMISQGRRVVRFPNDVVIGGGDIVLDAIRRELSAHSAPSSAPR